VSARPDPSWARPDTSVTYSPRAATIRTCRCGAVRTARHHRQKRRDAGSAADPPPPADPVATSGNRSPPRSAIAGWTVSAGPCAAMRSGSAGSRSTPQARPGLRRDPPLGRRPAGRWSPERIERPFGCSTSSRCAPRRAGTPAVLPLSRVRATSRVPCPRTCPPRTCWPPRASRVGACGATPRPDLGPGRPAHPPIRVVGTQETVPEPPAPRAIRDAATLRMPRLPAVELPSCAHQPA
jgi:hypothetical protein